MGRKLRDELLNGGIFDTLLEAKILIEQWRKEYNRFRPHSALGYRPPAPEALEPKSGGRSELSDRERLPPLQARGHELKARSKPRIPF